jgi:hypothetical protein
MNRPKEGHGNATRVFHNTLRNKGLRDAAARESSRDGADGSDNGLTRPEAMSLPDCRAGLEHGRTTFPTETL